MAPAVPAGPRAGSASSTSRTTLFYGGTLTAASYDAWLHQLAVRFVAVPDAPLDYSAGRRWR